jgi:hypothetical protein
MSVVFYRQEDVSSVKSAVHSSPLRICKKHPGSSDLALEKCRKTTSSWMPFPHPSTCPIPSTGPSAKSTCRTNIG